MKITWLSLLLFTILISCDTESSLEPYYEQYFIKYYGLEGDQDGVDILVNDDNTFLLLGSSLRTDGNSQIMLTKTDELGNEIWSYTYGESANEYAKSFLIGPSGNIFIIADVEESVGGKTNGKILKLNSEGALLDSVYIGTDGFNDIINGITLTDNQEIIVVGSTENVLLPGSGNFWDYFSIRMTVDFEELPLASWRRFYGYSDNDFGSQIIKKNDGSFTAFGTSDRGQPDNSQRDGLNLYIFNVNDAGDNSAIHFFGTLDDQRASQMISTSDGGFAMVGTSTSSSGDNSIYVARVRSNNDFLNAFQLNLEADIIGQSIAENSGDYIISGTSDTNGNTDIFLARVSTSGVVKWSRTFGGTDADAASKTLVLSDGSVAVIGTIEIESQTKMCFIKTNSKGELLP